MGAGGARWRSADGAQPRALAGSALAAVLLCAGCDEDGGGSSPQPTGTGSLEPEGTTSAAATASAEPPEPDNPHAGSWKASYQTERGAVTVSKAVPYDPWVTDDGTVASGKGEIAIEVADDGEVTGEGAGALGALALRGQLLDGTLRAGVTPADPNAPDAMTGVLVGRVEGDRIEAELRVASQDGTVVRKAALTLEREES